MSSDCKRPFSINTILCNDSVKCSSLNFNTSISSNFQYMLEEELRSSGLQFNKPPLIQNIKPSLSDVECNGENCILGNEESQDNELSNKLADSLLPFSANKGETEAVFNIFNPQPTFDKIQKFKHLRNDSFLCNLNLKTFNETYTIKTSSTIPNIPVNALARYGVIQHVKSVANNMANSSNAEKRIGHAYQSRLPARHKKPRTSFGKSQVALLESRFFGQKYLASAERATLAAQLNMSDAQVKTWFQNRRTKWRRQEAEEREHEEKAAAKFLTLASSCIFPTLNSTQINLSNSNFA